MLLVAAVAGVLLGFHAFSGSGPTITGSGVAATQTRMLPPFRHVEVNGFAGLLLRSGARQSVAVQADGNIVGQITTRVESGKLVIGNRPGSYTLATPVLVQITVPTLDGLVLNGTGYVSASAVHTRTFTVSLNGLGTINASGTVTSLHVSLDGTGEARLQRLVTRDATVVINGDGAVRLTATNSLSATITGNGEIRYRGNPRHITRSVTGNGAIGPG